ncbi:MAG: hypothetical protein LBR16_06145 [Treponema sp.]|jgi:hypothetical protein|nr:hypothetical protein [Treponema sp.]
MIIEEGDYKGSPLIVLKKDENDRYPFQFGVEKAKKILACIEDIRAFVDKYDKKKDA